MGDGGGSGERYREDGGSKGYIRASAGVAFRLHQPGLE